LGPILNDFFLTRKAIRNFVVANEKYIYGKVLDIGCGEKPYQNLFKTSQYIGIDIEQSGHNHEKSKIDQFYDGIHIPFENESFDNIVCFEVLEHVFEPDTIVREMQRILKPNGHILLTTPFIWNEHEIPYDYGRYTFYGLKHLFEKNGFVVMEQKRILSGIPLFIVLISLFFREGQEALKNMLPKNMTGKTIKALIYGVFRPVFFVFNIIGALTLMLPGSDRFYFNNGIIVKKDKR
jgi:SAM-dependent methyltransferase